MPVLSAAPSADEVRYKTLVEDQQVHRCYRAAGGDKGCLDEQGNCKRGYKSGVTRLKACFDEKGFPLYKRPAEADLLIVPHHREILLDWEGHHNLEFCGSSYTALYLYKYLFKGNKKVKVTFADEVLDSDEILKFIRGRKLCAMDAFWQILGFHTYPASFPSVRLVKCKMPVFVEKIKSDGQLCDLFVYFARRLSEGWAVFTRFFDIWEYSTKPPK